MNLHVVSVNVGGGSKGVRVKCYGTLQVFTLDPVSAEYLSEIYR